MNDPNTTHGMTPEERLIAYLDGELDAEARARFEAEAAADPRLAAELAAHRRVGRRVTGAYAPVLDEPVPPHLVALVTAANDRAPARAPSRLGLPQWAGLAACLVAGVLVGRLAWPQSGALAARDGALVARGSLDRALTAQLASDEGPIRIGLTFRAADGRYCRTFADPAEALAGLACRQSGRWLAVTTATLAPAAGAAPAYRTAASETPAAVLAAVDALKAGDALDAKAERAARDRAWVK